MINLKLARNKFWLPCVYLNVSWNYRFTLLQLRLLAETWHKWNWRMKFSNFAILDLDRNNFFFRSNRRNRIRKESKELSLRTNVSLSRHLWAAKLSSARCWANVARMLRIIYDKWGGGGAVISHRTLETLGRFIGLKGEFKPASSAAASTSFRRVSDKFSLIDTIIWHARSINWGPINLHIHDTRSYVFYIRSRYTFVLMVA